MIVDLLGSLQGLNPIARNWFILVADGTFKGTIILATVILLVKLWRRPTSQTRHLILFLAMISLALIPIVTRGLLIPAPAQMISGLNQVVKLPILQKINVAKPALLIHTVSSQSGVVAPQFPHWTVWLYLLWIAGVGFSGFTMIRGLLGAHRLSRTARIPEAPYWRTMVNELKAQLNVRIPVGLKFNSELQIPIVNGILNPVILLPESMADWPEERLQAVLLHELSHIKRYDNLTQTTANLVALFYWFNPLSWIALKLLKANREYACDDVVLWTGIQPTTYASELMMVIRSLKTTPPEMNLVSMFATTKIEQRMVNILAENQNRKPLTKRKITTLILIVTIISALLSLVSSIGLATAGNISDEEYQKLIERFRGVYLVVNLVPASPIDGKNLEVKGASADWPTLWPQEGFNGWITSPFSWPNQLGVDISSPEGTPIVATGNGIVVTAGWDNTYGNCVIIQHKVLLLQYPSSSPLYPISSLYSKLETILVHPGDVVRQGDIIGYSGNVESSDKPYLHYEIRSGSFVVDPKPFFKLQEEVMKGMYPFSEGMGWFISMDSHIYPVQTQ